MQSDATLALLKIYLNVARAATTVRYNLPRKRRVCNPQLKQLITFKRRITTGAAIRRERKGGRERAPQGLPRPARFPIRELRTGIVRSDTLWDFGFLEI